MKLKLLCSAAVGALFLFAACSDNSAGKKVFIEDGVYEADMYVKPQDRRRILFPNHPAVLQVYRLSGSSSKQGTSNLKPQI